VFAFGEQVVDTGAHGVEWVLGQGLCRECIEVIVTAVEEGTLPDVGGG